MRNVLIIATLTSGLLLMVGLGMYVWWQLYAEQRIFQGMAESTIRELENISNPDVLKKLVLTLAHQQNDLSTEANSLLGDFINLLMAACCMGFVFIWLSVMSAVKVFYREKGVKLGWLKWL